MSVYQFRVTQEYEETTTVSYVRDAIVEVEADSLADANKKVAEVEEWCSFVG